MSGREVLGLVLSILLVGLAGLGLTLTPRGLQPASLATILSLLALFLTALAYLRWSQLSRRRRFVLSSRRGLRSARRLGGSRRRGRMAYLLAAVVAIFAIAALAMTLTQNHPDAAGKGSAEFHVTWPKGTPAAEGASLQPGTRVTALAEIINQEERAINYSLRLSWNNSTLFRRAIFLGKNERWQGPVSATLNGPAGQGRILFLLFREGDLSHPYREAGLSVNLSEREQSGAVQQPMINGSSNNSSEQKPPGIPEQNSRVAVLSVGGGVSSTTPPPDQKASRESGTVQGGSAAVEEQSKEPSKAENISAKADQTTVQSVAPVETPRPNLPPSLADLRPGPSSPQIVGTTVLWKALASDPEGDEILYRFLQNNRSATNWSRNNTWSFVSAGLPPGKYWIEVQARDGRHASNDSFDASLSGAFTLLPGNQPPVIKDLVPDKPSPQLPGVTVFWKATASDPDGDRPLYRFLQNGQPASKWSKVGGWSWSTAGLPAGDYRIRVLARDGLHAAEDANDSFADASFTLASSNQIPVLQDLQADATSPRAAGTSVTWKATATDPDGDGILYRFMQNESAVTGWMAENTWTWDTAGFPAGKYRIKVLVRDGRHAAEDSFDAVREATFALAPQNEKPVIGSLTPNRASPQPAGAAITWKAVASDPEGDQIVYRFLQDGRAMTNWSASDSWIWNTSAAGNYEIKVLVRNGLHASEDSSDASLAVAFTLLASNHPPVLESLIPDQQSPGPAGTSVTWKAQASDADGDEILYRFMQSNRTMTNWSASGSWTWNTSAVAPGDYEIRVQARDGKHAALDSSDASLASAFTLLASNQPPVLESLNPDKPSPQLQGVTVFWKAAASDPDGDRIFYRFLQNGQPASKWSKANSWSWSTAGLQAGEYQIRVLARDGLHAAEDANDSFTDASFTLTSPNKIPELQDLKADVTSPRPAGAAVTWKAKASDPDGDGILYRFMLNNRTVTGWTAEDTWTWDTAGIPAAEYRIRVLVRDGRHAAEDSSDAVQEAAFTLVSQNEKPVIESLIPDRASPQLAGAAITWKAMASDADGDSLLFKFMQDGIAVTGWTAENTWTWETAASAPGDYDIKVLIRDGKHATEDSSDASLASAFTLLPSNTSPVVKSLTPDKPSPQVQGVTVLWRAAASDPESDPILYRFLQNDRAMTRWTDKNSWNWSTSGLSAGTYRISVQARDGLHAAEDSADSSLDAAYTLVTEIDLQIDQLIKGREADASKGKDYQSADIKVAEDNSTKQNAVLGNSPAEQETTRTPRRLG